MATATLLAQSSETWIYPPQTYTGVDGVYRPKNTWTKNHSNPPKRNNRYQAGNSASDGKYNGNMMSHFHFSTNGQSMRTFIRNIGGPEKITSIKLRLTCGHSYYSAMNLRVCLGPYWDTSPYHGKTSDSYDGLGIRHLTTVSVAKGETKTIDLTAYKSHFSNYETISMYVPGAYNKDYHAYGWVYGHSNSNASNRPELVITYNTNTAPRTPGLNVNTTADRSGYIKPDLNVTVISNGDPDNNLSSTPYGLSIHNQNGGAIYESPWTSTNNYTYDLSNYRGQTVKLTGWIRDTEDLRATTTKNVYINSLPYWQHYGAEAEAVKFSTGVINGIFKNDITISWPKASDAQSQSQSLSYAIYYQIGTDKGPSGDTSANCLASGLTQTYYSFNASRLNGQNVQKGERVYFSVWVHDGLEWSSYRLVSSWIYREVPPSTVEHISPEGGNYESKVFVSWVRVKGLDGSLIETYKVNLINHENSIVKTYNVDNASLMCEDLHLIPRGKKFRFSVIALDGVDNESKPGYSNELTRNTPPTDPKNFRMNSKSQWCKNQVFLTWGKSTDIDGDEVRYEIYCSVNNGPYQLLAIHLTSTTYTHYLENRFKPGTVLNYYIQAYDKWYAYSNKVYVNTKAQINVPPSNPSLLLPYSNRILYTNVPRITFRSGSSYNGESLKIIISINGKEYSSDKDISYFNKSKYGNNEEGMFIVPDNAPLNYSSNNKITIKCYDGIDYSNIESRTLSCDAPTVNTKNTGDVITANDFNSLKAMINANRFAYGLSEYNWHDGFLQANKQLISKHYFEQAIEGIYELTTFLNNKTSSTSLKRIYAKDVLTNNSLINKNIFNNMYNMIKKS